MNDLLQALFVALKLGAFLILLYVPLRLFYNVYLHPLRSIPGPLAARACLLTYQRHLVTGSFVQWMHQQHLAYGPVVRYAPDQVSFTSAAAWKDIYGHAPTGGNFPKDLKFYGPDIYGAKEPGLIRSDDVAHARQRKLVSHAFSDKALREQEGLLKGYVELLIQRLKEVLAEKKGKGEAGKVDMVDWYNFTTFDIMADLTFGEPLHLLDDGALSPWVKSMFSSIKMVTLVQAIRSWPGMIAFVNRLVPKDVKDKRERHVQHSISRVEKRLRTKTERPDIWTYVMRHSQDDENRGKGLTSTEMHSNGSLFMLAGTETTATQLSHLTYRLHKCPEVLDRLVEEIRQTFPKYEDMTIGALARLDYLNAVIEEGLRIYPPVPVGLPRVVPPHGAVVAGTGIVGGTAVSVSQFAAYHAPSNFKDPEGFHPERWLPEGEKEFAGDSKSVLQPFSFGPRNCVGKNLAYHEMRLVLSTLLWNFDLKFCEESEGWVDQKNFILWEKRPLMVELLPVEPE